MGGGGDMNNEDEGEEVRTWGAERVVKSGSGGI